MADAARDAQRAQELLLQFKADLRALVTQDAYNPWAYVVITGLLDFAHGMMRRAVRAEPHCAPVLLDQITQVHQGVTRAAADPAAPASETPLPPGTFH